VLIVVLTVFSVLLDFDVVLCYFCPVLTLFWMFRHVGVVLQLKIFQNHQFSKLSEIEFTR